MRTFIYSLFLFFILSTTYLRAQKVILKLDDLGVKENVCSCSETIEFLIGKGIKASYGVIANRIDETAKNTLTPYLEAKNGSGEDLVELWHHGLDHKRPEFEGTSYSYQKEHFDNASSQINNALGIVMHTFGTPFNANDSVTNTVIAENADYRVFLFGKKEGAVSPEILFLTNRVNIEKETGKVDYNLFLENYKEKKDLYKDYIVLQAHPNGWKSDKIGELNKIIDYLLQQGCEFVLPYEYYLARGAK